MCSDWQYFRICPWQRIGNKSWEIITTFTLGDVKFCFHTKLSWTNTDTGLILRTTMFWVLITVIEFIDIISTSLVRLRIDEHSWYHKDHSRTRMSRLSTDRFYVNILCSNEVTNLKKFIYFWQNRLSEITNLFYVRDIRYHQHSQLIVSSFDLSDFYGQQRGTDQPLKGYPYADLSRTKTFLSSEFERHVYSNL